MAERPYFYVWENRVDKKNADFEWFSGFAVSQKQKCIDSFHRTIRKDGRMPLEVSSKSKEELGRKLSAFNLKLDGHPLECVYQSSKVFEYGGPYVDLLDVKPKEAKRDERIHNSGKLVKFRYGGTDWPLSGGTMFYDYIYYCAVKEHLNDEELKLLSEYNAFTDIVFNPNKSKNTQARSAAIVVYIYKLKGCLPELSMEEFIRIHWLVVKA